MGVAATGEIQNRHFEKVIACMVLKLTVYVRNVIFFISQKSSEIFRNIFGKIFNFDPCCTKNRLL